MIHAFQLVFAVALASPEAVAAQVRAEGATDVRVQLVQLDADDAMEAVVQYILPGSGVHAQVLDSRANGWQVAGKFNTWWNFVPEDADRFIELRETVRLGTQDVVVRTRGGGTEDSRTVLEIWRMRDGVMVNVLTLKEQETAMEHPSGDVFTTVARVEFEPGRVTVRSLKNPGEKRSCVSYFWDEAGFRFGEERGGCPTHP
ncbi:MAG TPA: hypothetical protein VFQ91_08020 [Bryobacteraceae bacterium]|nr:hypothetical protein [Bryobacteraceae bacterium]